MNHHYFNGDYLSILLVMTLYIYNLIIVDALRIKTCLLNWLVSPVISGSSPNQTYSSNDSLSKTWGHPLLVRLWFFSPVTTCCNLFLCGRRIEWRLPFLYEMIVSCFITFPKLLMALVTSFPPCKSLCLMVKSPFLMPKYG